MRLASVGWLSLLENHSTVITPTRLLASVAHAQFVSDRLNHRKNTWQRPTILNLGAWLTRQWQQARYSLPATPALLSPAQEHLLWRRIIAEEHATLFDPDSAAVMASRAARLLAEWDISKQDEAWNDRGDAAQFQRWQRRFDQICRRESWITRAGIWESQKPASNCVFLLTEPGTPALRRIAAKFQSLTADHSPVRAAGTRFEEFNEELEFAARWARARFESRRSESIAVVVPDLATHRTLVERTFHDIFYPGHQNRNPIRAFSLTATPPLSSEPLIAGALLLLEISRPEIPMAAATSILRSPWTRGSAAERNQRAQADLNLRRRRDLDVTFPDLESAAARCPQLANTLRSVKARVAGCEPLNIYAAWALFFGDLLQAFGWPGDAELTLTEADLADAWQAVLSQLASLSLVSGPVPLEAALADLRRLLESPREPENLAAPVQILDAREAPGLRFDAALAVGLSEQTWPPLESRSPLIPFSLQRNHRLPASSPQLQRAHRASLTRGLFSAAPEMHATWSGRLSPVAAGFVFSNSELPAIWKGKSTWQSFKPAILDELEDSQAPPFLPTETTRGGTGIIKAQSLCPFRAFAEYRLQARSPEEGCLGLDSRERGGNLHQVLQFVWQKLQTRDRLLATPAAALEILVEEVTSAAVRSRRESSFGEIVASVEVGRLKEVVLEWLGIEKQRKQPFTVETVEEERYFELGGLRLRLRLDRIDRLRNGQALLIDYKSGEQQRKKLERDRPAEPQLLVYAAGMANEVDGLLFAQLRARDVKAVGFTRDKHFVSRTVDVEGSRWDNFLDERIAKVEQLAQEFKSGYAAVAPLPNACDFCAQKPFCRIQELRASEEEAEE